MFNFNVLGWLIVWMTNIPALFIVFLWTFEEAVVFRVLIFGIQFYNRKGPSWRLCVGSIDVDIYVFHGHKDGRLDSISTTYS